LEIESRQYIALIFSKVPLASSRHHKCVPVVNVNKNLLFLVSIKILYDRILKLQDLLKPCVGGGQEY